MKWLVEFDMVTDEISASRDGAEQPVGLVLSQGKIKTVVVDAEEQNEAVEKGVGLIAENIVAQKQSLNRAVRKYREAVELSNFWGRLDSLETELRKLIADKKMEEEEK